MKINIDKKNYAPAIASALWVLFSVISIFTIDAQLLGNVYTIVSIVGRVFLPIVGIVFVKKAFIDKSLTSLSYGHYLNILGYSVTLTYVLYMLPSVVSDYYNYDVNLTVFTIFVIISTLCPAALYLMLRSAKFKLQSGFFKESEVNLSRKEKKKYKKGLRKLRTPLQNVWFEFFDPLLWAIILILILNTFLFQHYQIPTSSMVDEFLEKDRVFSAKLLNGVQLPLSEYQLPELSKIEVGEIVTFKNPKLDDPNSDIYFNSLFSRIFHPFFFYLTFSMVDIDKKDNGEPKERELVKRVIGMPGEKISMVNDKVYKKKSGQDWILMSEIPGEEEWGNSDLFFINNKNSGAQIINPAARETLDRAAKMVFESDTRELSKELSKYKKDLLEVSLKDNFIIKGSIDNNINRLSQQVSVLKRKLGEMYWTMTFLNLRNESVSQKENFVLQYNESIKDYDSVILLDMLKFCNELLNMEANEIDTELNTDVVIEDSYSPYKTFVTKLDALIKVKKLELFFNIINNESYLTSLNDLTALLVYVRGYEFGDITGDGMDNNVSFFGAGNLPEFPQGNEYIAVDEYFLMGDNRYNSNDSRMGDDSKELWLTNDHSIFGEKIEVHWEPYSIHNRYIHGKIAFRGFPFHRIKLY